MGLFTPGKRGGSGGEGNRGGRGCQCQQCCPMNPPARPRILMEHPGMEPEVLPTALSRICRINSSCLSFPLSKIPSSAAPFPRSVLATPPLLPAALPTPAPPSPIFQPQLLPHRAKPTNPSLPNTIAPFARRGKTTCPSSCAASVINSALQYTAPLRNRQGLLAIMKLGSLIPHANELGGKGITSPDTHKVEDLASTALFKSLTSFLPCKQASKYE